VEGYFEIRWYHKGKSETDVGVLELRDKRRKEDRYLLCTPFRPFRPVEN
jgi:hypothetical protein